MMLNIVKLVIKLEMVNFKSQFEMITVTVALLAWVAMNQHSNVDMK